MNEQLIKDLRQLLNTLESSKITTRVGNAGTPKYYGECSDHSKKDECWNQKMEDLKQLKENSKNYKYIGKEVIIKPSSASSFDIVSSFGGFLPRSLTMIVKNLETLDESLVEIANITVMGDPQLVNFNGVTDSTQRGTSLLFRKTQNVDFCVFGAANGQGLDFSLVNPNHHSVSVSIVVSGFEASSEMVGQR